MAALAYWKQISWKSAEEALRAIRDRVGYPVSFVVVGFGGIIPAVLWGQQDLRGALLGLAGAVVTMFLLWLIFFLANIWNIPSREDAAQKAEIAALKLDCVQMEITNVAFDANGPTQMYVECGIANPTTPTVLRDWALSISTDNEEKELRPHDVSIGRFRNDPLFPGHPLPEDLSRDPLPAGSHRSLRFTFVADGLIAQEAFGKAGTIFKLTGHDVRARTIEAIYSMPEAES